MWWSVDYSPLGFWKFVSTSYRFSTKHIFKGMGSLQRIRWKGVSSDASLISAGEEVEDSRRTTYNFPEMVGQNSRKDQIQLMAQTLE